MKDRIREIGKDRDAADELAILKQWLSLAEQITALKKTLKAQETELDGKAFAHYAKLTVDDIQTLVVDDKWLATLSAAVHGEVERVSQALTRRVKELAERYATPLPQLAEEVAALSEKVAAHLRSMGFAA